MRSRANPIARRRPLLKLFASMEQKIGLMATIFRTSAIVDHDKYKTACQEERIRVGVESSFLKGRQFQDW